MEGGEVMCMCLVPEMGPEGGQRRRPQEGSLSMSKQPGAGELLGAVSRMRERLVLQKDVY